MPIGKIFLWVSVLGLIGLVVALVIGAAIFIVPVVVLGIAGWYIYKRARRPKYGSGW
jgi:low temperature requirement protein LtrA